MLFSQLVQGKFIHRENLFRAIVSIGGREYRAHLPNSGKLEDLLIKDQPIYLIPTPDHTRKTSYAISLVQLEYTLVSIDARLPNHLFTEYLKTNTPDVFKDYAVQKEVTYQNHRFDFRLNRGQDVFWVETKSVTCVDGRIARFPDAISKRAHNHLNTLMDLQSKGEEAAVIFIIQRDDVESFSPNVSVDPVFAKLLDEAVKNNVLVKAYKCKVSLREINISQEVPVMLE